MAWGQPDDALQLVLDRNLELELVQAASGEAKPLNPVRVEGLERLMSVLQDRDDEEAAGGHEAGLDPTRLRPRTFEDWRNTRTAPSPQPSPPSPSTSHPPPLPPPAAGIPVASGSVTPLVIKSRDGRLTVQATSSNEVDGSVLLLDDQSRTRGDSDFVFCNAPRSPHGAVVLAAASHEGRAQAVAVDVGRLREEGVRRCAVIVSSARPLEDGHVRVSLQTGQDRDLELPLPREPGLLAAVVAEVYLRPSTIDDWRVRALAQGWADGLAGVVRSYGWPWTTEGWVGSGPSPIRRLRATAAPGTAGFGIRACPNAGRLRLRRGPVERLRSPSEATSLTPAQGTRRPADRQSGRSGRP